MVQEGANADLINRINGSDSIEVPWKKQCRGLTPSAGGFAVPFAAGKVFGVMGDVGVMGSVDTTFCGTGPLRLPARTVGVNEGVLIDSSYGLQSRAPASGPFSNVQTGEHGDLATKYLYTVDERGVNIVLEQTPFPTREGLNNSILRTI